MSQYFTDFAGETDATAHLAYEPWSPGSGRTVSFSSELWSNTPVLNVDHGNDSRHFFRLLNAPSTNHVEIYARIAASNGEADFYVGGGGTSGNYNAYKFDIRNESNEVRISKFVNGASTFGFVTAPFAFSKGGQVVHLRCLWNGNTGALKLKLWPDADSEPVAWSVEAIDASLTAPGTIGVFDYGSAPLRIDRLGIGTNGDSAPGFIDPNAPADNLRVSSVTATSARLEWDGAKAFNQIELELSDGTPVGTDIAGPDGYKDWPGLTPATDYRFRVRVSDSAQVDTYSDWSSWLYFSTLVAGAAGSVAEQAAALAGFSVTATAGASVQAPALASDSVSAIAGVSAAILSSAQVADQSGDFPAALAGLEAMATGSALVDALANAAGAIQAGAGAGEAWAAQAQAVAKLMDRAAGSDALQRATENAINAASSDGSSAAAQFMAALEVAASVTDNATINDAFVAMIANFRGISSGAVATAGFDLNAGLSRSLQSGAITGEAWGLAVTLNAALVDVCSVSDLMAARVNVALAVSSGAIASSAFSVIQEGLKYLVMGCLTLRAALQQTATARPALQQTTDIEPALSQTTKIKSGH